MNINPMYYNILIEKKVSESNAIMRLLLPSFSSLPGTFQQVVPFH